MPNTFNNAFASLTTTNETDLYTSPTGASNVAIVLSCVAANVDGSNSVDFTLKVTDGSNVEQSTLLFTVPVPADTSLEAISNKVVLKNGQKLRGTASAANDLKITVSVLEITV